MEWEKPYLEALIDALHPSGRVLEVGFGLGFSSERIQFYHPTEHIIIEHRPEDVAKAQRFAKKHPHVTVIQDTWQNALPKLGVFDAIFFNDFEPDREVEIQQIRQMGGLIASKEKEMNNLVAEKIPHLTTIRYSDQDIEDFYEQVGKNHPQDLARFLFTLKSNKQISEEQYQKMLKKYKLEKNEIANVPTQAPAKQQFDQTFPFFEACAKKHMHKGSRFSSFSMNPLSKFENPQFFDHVITSPDFDYHEETISVSVPESCPYYKSSEALVMVIEML